MDDRWLHWALAESSASRMLTLITALGQFDRYQASDGILAAAQQVALAAAQRGMVEVDIHHFEADGARRWWDFHAPLAWTPRQARLTLSAQPSFTLDHQVAPFTLATYSAPASGRFPLVSVDDNADVEGKVVLIPAADYGHTATCLRLTQRGACGFITDASARRDSLTGGAFRGRLELAPGSGLFAFSVLPDELHLLQRAACAGAAADIEIVIERSATMPVVSALVPGDAGAGEIWITAHLCHSRAGANDNASGVSASLEIAALLQQLSNRGGAAFRYPVRMVWGPEFLGVAAIQYKRAHQPGPIAVINLDMVGEDQRQCGSPMCIELPPAGFDSPLGELAQTLMDRVFSLTADDFSTWVSLPFQGFSDHALFMNHRAAHHNCPAVQLCHINDRFNHTAADTPDKVSAIEMKRAVAVALALVMQLHTLDVRQIRPQRTTPQWEEGGLVGCWQGPLNLRGLIQRLEAPLREVVGQLIAGDKRYLALLHHCALNADGRQQEAVLATAAATLGLTLSPQVVALCYAVFAASDCFQVCPPDRALGEIADGSTPAF